MQLSLKKKAGTILLAGTIASTGIGTLPVLAAADNIEIVLTDVTAESQNTLKGEAKIKVSVKGAGGNVSAAQTALKFDGDLKYKSIEFLQGESNPPECFHIPPNSALANNTKTLMPSIVTNKAGQLAFTDEATDLFILTFSGEPGESVTLSVDGENNADSFCITDGKEIPTKSESISITVAASDVTNEGMTATVKLTMDKVNDIAVKSEGDYIDSKITLKITNEKNGSVISTVFNTVSKANGGHYDSTITTPTFIVDNSVLSGDTYTVEIYGPGYVTYKKTGVDFKNTLELTNADFVPGDVNSDGKVDETDKTLYNEIIANGEYDEVADFNRDGKVDKYDNVFEGIGNEGEGGGSSSGGGGGSSSGGSSSGGGGGSSSGGGGGSSSGGGGGSSSTDNNNTSKPSEGTDKPTTPVNDEVFTDLGNYAWAKDAIYSLKEKGIISGTSETTFSPASNIKRGDFILILTRMLGIDNEFTENFADVLKDSYYYNAVGSAKAAGIASGDGMSFMPENSITRQDLITLAYRAFLNEGYIEETDDMSSLDTFADKADISDYAVSPMASMVKAGIIQGSDGRVNPKGNATRAEVAVMCSKLVALIK